MGSKERSISPISSHMARAVIPCEVILESGDLVDYAAIAAFQRQAFVNVRAPIAPASVQTSAYYAWKYRTPWGPARIATVTYGGDVASMVAAIPTVFVRGIDRWTAWQICGIATAPSMRRRGLLRRGLAALLANLPIGDGVFCLPNRDSHSLMLQMGFQDIGRLSLYVSGAALFTRPRGTTTAIAAEPMPVCAEATEFRAPQNSISVTWRLAATRGILCADKGRRCRCHHSAA
jgi:Acetyltransferase (GNAT) domain